MLCSAHVYARGKRADELISSANTLHTREIKRHKYLLCCGFRSDKLAIKYDS